MSKPDSPEPNEIVDRIRTEDGEFIPALIERSSTGLIIKASNGSLSWIKQGEIRRVTTKGAEAGLTEVDLVLSDSNTVSLSLSEQTLAQVLELLESEERVAPKSASSGSGASAMSPEQHPVGGQGAKSRKSRYLVGLGAVALLAVVVGIITFFSQTESDGGGASSAPTMQTLRGAVAMRSSDQNFLGGVSECGGSGQSALVQRGESVTARDGDGKILSAGRLVNPATISDIARWEKEYKSSPGYSESQTWTNLMSDSKFYDNAMFCVLFFDIDVPVEEFYEFEMGSSGETLTFQREELEATNWMTLITID